MNDYAEGYTWWYWENVGCGGFCAPIPAWSVFRREISGNLVFFRFLVQNLIFIGQIICTPNNQFTWMQACACDKLERSVSTTPKWRIFNEDLISLLISLLRVYGVGITDRELGWDLSQKIPGITMKDVQQLTRCPKCGKRLWICGRIQICIVCGYWTPAGTARMDSIAAIL